MLVFKGRHTDGASTSDPGVYFRFYCGLSGNRQNLFVDLAKSRYGNDEPVFAYFV